jgi:hypothetical protein
MNDEIHSLEHNKVWSLVQRPKDHKINVIGTNWIFKNKQDENGLVIHKKESLAVQGYSQVKGMDYEDTFVLVARLEAICLLLAYASFHDFMLYQMDVKSAFLNGPLKEVSFVAQPPSLEDPHYPDHVYLLHKDSMVSRKLHVLGTSSLGISYSRTGLQWVSSIPPFSPNGLKG